MAGRTQLGMAWQHPADGVSCYKSCSKPASGGLPGQFENCLRDETCPFGKAVNLHPFIGAVIIAADGPDPADHGCADRGNEATVGAAAGMLSLDNGAILGSNIPIKRKEFGGLFRRI